VTPAKSSRLFAAAATSWQPARFVSVADRDIQRRDAVLLA